jgi:hypothetical protein
MVRLFFYGGWGSRLIRPLGTFSHKGRRPYAPTFEA